MKIFITMLLLTLLVVCSSSKKKDDMEPEVILKTTIYMNSQKTGDKSQFEKTIYNKISRLENDKYIVEERVIKEKTYCEKEDCETTVEDSVDGVIYRKKHKLGEKLEI